MGPSIAAAPTEPSRVVAAGRACPDAPSYRLMTLTVVVELEVLGVSLVVGEAHIRAAYAGVSHRSPRRCLLEVFSWTRARPRPSSSTR
jgi:hypothetical protein